MPASEPVLWRVAAGLQGRQLHLVERSASERNGGDTSLKAGMCGWTNGITNYSDDLNTEYDALQITLAQSMWKGLAFNMNYQWASAFDEQGGYSTWSKAPVHGRDGNVRDQQIVMYGSYDLPFGKGKQFLSGANHATDLLIGGYQISTVLNWSGGLPYTLGFSNFGATRTATTILEVRRRHAVRTPADG